MPAERVQHQPAMTARMSRRVRGLLVICTVGGLVTVVVTSMLLLFASVEGARRCLEVLPRDLQVETSAEIRDGVCVLSPHGNPGTIQVQLGSYDHAVAAALAALGGVVVLLVVSVYGLVLLRRELRAMNQRVASSQP
jgi:hypothetical protein